MNRPISVAGCVLLSLCLFVASAATGKTIYVDDDASGRADGTSWRDAYPYLQDALAVAAQEDEVRVAQGVYRPNQGVSIQPRAPFVRARSIAIQATDPDGQYLAFQLKSGVAIVGGFGGLGADDPDARDVEQHATILTGDLHNNDVPGWGPNNPVFLSMRTDNSLHVVAAMEDVDSTAVLDGFIIESASDGAVLLTHDSPHLANCTFRNNYSIQQRSSGCGVYCSGGQPTLSNCVFEGGYADQGCTAIETWGAKLTLLECRFINNQTTANGGAILSVAGSDLSLVGCTFEKNAAQRGGAIYQDGFALTLMDCRFEGNAASDNGGAVLVSGQATASIKGCIFRQNWAAGGGGAVYSESSSLTLGTCTFTGNRSGAGGAVYALARTLSDPGARHVTMAQCLLAGNRAAWGGAVACDGTRFMIDGCTFADNSASCGNSFGWALVGLNSNPFRAMMTNCIIWDGQSSISSEPIKRSTPSAVAKNDAIAVTYSDVQGGRAGEGNIDADPLFAAPGHWVDPADPRAIVDGRSAWAVWVDGDYHLKSPAGRWDPASENWVLDKVTSPCIDAGEPNSPVGDEPEPNGGRINMGAYAGTARASKSSMGRQ